MDDVAAARRRYAEDLRYVGPAASDAVIEAFAMVPRELFLGPGPWRIVGPGRRDWVTADANPQHVYHNVLIAIDTERGLNNGQPSLWAFLYDLLNIRRGDRVLHVGCGTGYYSAILAELTGPGGQVTAVEHDPALADRARASLADWPQATVVTGDGYRFGPGPVDVIVVNAGITAPSPAWLDSLTPGGRMTVPLTTDDGLGGFVNVTGVTGGFAARFVSPTGIFPCIGGREPEAERRLRDAFQRQPGGWRAIRSLRRDAHDPAESCWLHGAGFCLSVDDPPAIP